MHRKTPVVLRDNVKYLGALQREVAKIKTLELEEQTYVRNSMFFPEGIFRLAGIKDQRKQKDGRWTVASATQ